MARPVVELRPGGAGRVSRWICRWVRRRKPRARVTARPEVRLGEPIEVEWRVDCPDGNLGRVSVTLVGQEIARRRISARSGIMVVPETHTFVTLEIARVSPEPDLRVVDGRGTVVVPAGTVPSVAGARNEIAWAIVVEAESTQPSDTPILRESFPIVVLPPSR